MYARSKNPMPGA